MKILGIVLIALGIFMLFFGGVTFTTKEKVADVGPVEINRKENKTVAWPKYAGGAALAVGILVLVIPTNKRPR